MAAVKIAMERARACRAEINAFVTLSDVAEVQATESERRRADGTARLLEGVPVAVKDLIDTKDIETSYGSKVYRGNHPTQDAVVVDTLRRNGAIVIGKTTTHEFAWGVTTESDEFGDTLNPWDLTTIPGGSSGGAAASIAFGAVSAGLGTDTGGSVRIPASLCGVVGFKPSFGRLPTTGVFPLAPSLDHVGVLGATVGDISRLSAAFGIETAHRTSAPPELLAVREMPTVPLDESVALAFDVALDRISAQFPLELAASATVFDNAFDIFAHIVRFEAGAIHLARHDVEFIRANYSAESCERVEAALDLKIHDYAYAQGQRRCFTNRLSNFLDDRDFLLLPTTPCTAPKLRTRTMAIGEWTGTAREALMTYTCPFNLSGCPAMSVPLRHPSLRLPVGMQIVGKRGQDESLLEFARCIESIIKAE
ncbi:MULTISPECIES: amidase [unclassified Sinorhizobium]|uniref:amidase n=1 Tax=unclassified Sinorhizobium TaxID=2613772 RepID=UPI0024C38D51|nr:MULTISPECIES: amidase [unclassified Sinorhizobium]MDK1373767.1 amidase [Sinorhizobium sp. 6-70]MDK1478732.1 amidase [Sinorhizobium sp. 6-117]